MGGKKDPDGPSCVEGWLIVHDHHAARQLHLAMQLRWDGSRDRREYALICTIHKHVYEIGPNMVEGAREGEWNERNKKWCPGCTPSAHAAPEGVAGSGRTTQARSDYHRRVTDLESSEREGGSRKESTRPLRKRCREARSLVIDRSGGRCESPECAGPDFCEVTTAGDPILEVDHVQDLAHDGEDHPANMIALCPNCHAVKTRGRHAEQLRETLRATATELHEKAMASTA